MKEFIADMKMPKSVRKFKHNELNIKKILKTVTTSVAGVDESTCFPTLCIWLITHKDELVGVKSINLTNFDLSDKSVNMIHFANVLRNGALARLTKLNVSDNEIGDEGMKVFSSALSSGALASLTKLWLSDNQIADAGMIAFAEALKPTSNFPVGSLNSLTNLFLEYNPASNSAKDTMKAVASSRGISLSI